MSAYIIRRILFMIPTIFGIMLVSFVVVQFAPGGPVERVIAQLSGNDTGATSRISGSAGGDFGSRGALQTGGQMDVNSKYRGAQGLDPAFIKSLEKQFGFDKPAYQRFFLMLWNYVRFDFGKSYFRDVSVLQLIKEKLPVSISLGLWMTLLSYLISIPLGIRKAVQDGSPFDMWTSGVIIIGYAIPGFLFAILLDHSFCRRLVLQYLSAARIDLRRLGDVSVVAEDPRLFLASDAADRVDGACRLRHHDASDQKLVPGRVAQAVRSDRARQGLLGNPGAVRAYLP